MTFLFDFFAVV